MKTIWKYSISLAGRLTVEMPKGATILAFQMQGGLPCLWALTDQAENIEERYFRVVATGWSINVQDGEEWRYVGTVQQDGGLVWHLFEIVTT